MDGSGDRMKILALTDDVVESIYSSGVRQRLAEVQLIVSCGDLPREYLEYVVTQLNVPLVYVPGNHDPDNFRIEGGESIDGRWRRIGGVAVAGLGGSLRYKSDGRHQYSEREMYYRVARLLLTVRTGRRGLDLLVTHAPPRGVHDAQDLTHRGFECFHRLLQMARPRLMLHGHIHASPNLALHETRVSDTLVVNAYPYRLIDLPERL